MSEMNIGSIQAKEAKQVLTDVLVQRKVSREKWGIKKGSLHLLIGSRIVTFCVKPGKTYYTLRALAEQLNQAINDLEKWEKNKGQVDLEDVIKERASV